VTGARRLVILGATGSIGRSTCEVVRRAGGRYRVTALAADRDAAGLVALAREMRPEAIALADPGAAREAAAELGGSGMEVMAGSEGILALARRPADIVVNGVVGAAGLPMSMAALEAGRTLALANKESLVMAGALIMEAARRHGAAVLPIDSEHCSLFQCLQGRSRDSVRRITLTASGGPFRLRTLDEMDRFSPREALCHPTWRMGKRITIDSATLMNKGFEVIEARWLFDLPPERIDVVVHPQSIVHALVALSDGSQVAHLSGPDMRLPIEFVLSYPDPPPAWFEPLDLTRIGRLEFERPDRERFPCLRLAEEALAAGGTSPAVLNAADEVMVEAYLDERVRFSRIPAVIEEVLAAHDPGPGSSVEEVLAADRWAREETRDRIARVS
jgi:1-deoxy-D-xylulose-5-phosphate reductoisomerase